MQILDRLIVVTIIAGICAGCASFGKTTTQGADRLASSTPSCVDVEWSYNPMLHPDKELAGCKLWRRPSKDGAYVKLSDEVLTPVNTEVTSAGQVLQKFRYTDFDVQAGQLYEYQKEMVFADGSSERDDVGVSRRAQALQPAPWPSSGQSYIAFNPHQPGSM